MWARWALVGLFGSTLVAACGSKDDKDKTRTDYPNDSDVAGDGSVANGNGNGGGNNAAGGDRSGDGEGGAMAGNSAGVGGDGLGPGGAGIADGGTGMGEGGTPTIGEPPATTYDDIGRGTTGPLVFQITKAQTPAVVGQALNYAITVGNTSDVAVDMVNVLMRLPPGMNVAYADDAMPNIGVYCGNYVCDPNEEATWNLGTIPAKSTQTIWVRGNILNTVGDGDEVAPLFRVTAKDVDVLNITPPTPVLAASPAELTLTADADPVVPGQLVELTLDVGQTGATPLKGATLSVELPGGLEATSVSDSGTIVKKTISWSIGDIAVGASFRRSLWVKVHAGSKPGDILNPRASLSYEGGLDVDNVAQVPLSVVPKAEPLTLTVAELNAPAAPAGTVAYQVTVANTALRAIDGIGLTLQVPPEITIAYAQDSQPDIASYCGNYVCGPHEEAPWDIGTLEAGTSQTITFIATVPANTSGSGTLITTPFALRATGVNPINTFKTVPVFAKSAAQLVLGTEVSPVAPGQTFTYDLDVGQVGAKALAATKLTAFMPSGVTVKSVSDSGTDDGGVVTWDLGSVGVAETRHRSVEVTLADDAVAGSTLFARSRLTYSDGIELDAQSEYPVAVVAEPLALSVTLAADKTAGTPGAKVLYSTTIKNNAARAVDGVGLMMRTGDFSFGYAADADPDVNSYCGNYVCGFGEEAPWTLGSLKAGGTSLITANVTVLASLTAGSLLVSRQILTATDLGGTIMLQKTLPTKAP